MLNHLFSPTAERWITATLLTVIYIGIIVTSIQ